MGGPAVSRELLPRWVFGTGAWKHGRDTLRGLVMSEDGREVTSLHEGLAVTFEVATGLVLERPDGAGRAPLERAVEFPEREPRAARGRGEVALWRPDRDEPVGLRLRGLQPSPEPVLTPDDRALLVGYDHGVVGCWDVATARLRWTEARPELCEGVFAGPRGEAVVLRREADGTRVTGLAVDTGRALWTTLAPLRGPFAQTPDRALLVGSRPTALGLVDLHRGLPVDPVEGHGDLVCALAWSPGGRLLASGARDGSLRVWDTHEGTLVWTLEGHLGAITQLAWCPTGRTLYSVARDRVPTVRSWDPSQGSAIDRYTLSSTEGLAWLQEVGPTACGWDALALSPEGDALAACFDYPDHTKWSNQTLVLLDASLRERAVLTLEPWSTVSLRFARDGRSLALLGPDGSVQRVDLAAPAPPAGYPPDGRAAWCVFMEEGRTACVLTETALVFRDLGSGQRLGVLGGEGRLSGPLAVSPRDAFLAHGARDPEVLWWDLEAQVVRHRLGLPVGASVLAFSPDERSLAVGSLDGVVRVYTLPPEREG
ncbi:MAG: hypothetical protein HY909_28675 [Deltaproteobacteria bacterium]|nr:hypothetical protein [Deltaproteobacteria bacterium]